jgi:methionyl-tRNA formyltransferase
MRIIFFGMLGRFSLPPLQRLLSLDIQVCALVVPAAPKSSDDAIWPLGPPATPADLPVLVPSLEQNILPLAWERHIPVWQVSSLPGQALSQLAKLRPELIIVACWPYRLPRALLDLPKEGCLNLHPALLPAYRGPEPLFWQARQDERETGVTLHFLDDGLDSGDIVAQTRLERPDGLSGAALEQQGAEAGAALLVAAIEQLQAGQPLPRRPQVEQEASTYPRPCPADFVIPTTWPAQRAFNFISGAENWPLRIDLGAVSFEIRLAKSYSARQTLDRPYRLFGDELWVQFQPGVLHAKVNPQSKVGVNRD